VLQPAIHIDTLLTEAELADEFTRAVMARELPEKFFYWFPLSVKAWLALCQDGPYRNFSRSEQVIRGALPRLRDRLARVRRLEVVSLGAGHGAKDLHILKTLAEDSKRLRYVPVDAGLSLLEMACAQSASVGIPHHGIKADLTNPKHLAALRARNETLPRLLLLIGNSLGAFDPPAMLAALRPLLRDNDLVLLDGELGQDRETLAGYDNPTNRAFALAPLLSIGLSESDGRLVFDAMDPVRPGVHRLGKSFHVNRDRELTVGGLPLTLRAGEHIRMSHSGKYSREGFMGVLEESGLEAVEEWTSDDGRFLMVLAKPRRRLG
jgi:uncharacterized SAM-dependent methyltransferase